ncbi:MAG: hypothetical protein ACLU0O_01505 [Collinsella sp.]
MRSPCAMDAAGELPGAATSPESHRLPTSRIHSESLKRRAEQILDTQISAHHTRSGQHRSPAG